MFTYKSTASKFARFFFNIVTRPFLSFKLNISDILVFLKATKYKAGFLYNRNIKLEKLGLNNALIKNSCFLGDFF